MGLLLTIVLTAPVLATLQTPPPLPATVAAKIASLDQACRAAGGRPGKATYVFAQDFTGDGRVDYLVSEGNYACTGKAALLRHNGQAAVEIYLGDARGGAARVWREMLLGYRILDQQPRLVQIAQSGTACGTGSTATSQCGAALRWNAAAQRFDSEPTGSRAAPGGAVTRPAITALAPAAAAAREDQASFTARCKAEMVRRYPDGARWADSECKEKWARITATAPMADAVLALAPERPGALPALAAIKTRLPGVRWHARPVAGAAASGNLGALGVQVEGKAAAIRTVSFGWSEAGAEIPYEAIEAMKVRGIAVSTIGCQAFGAGESTQIVRIAPAGRAPFAMTVYSRSAPTANAWSSYSAGIELTARVPTLATIRAAEPDGDWQAACPS